ncbi:MAG TPA: TAT-variant-translocated molybdopterin oxidoreductase [Caldilineae bacterium]|nr:TAT-variant-translocated molybdopterin oxidoreductase [Caldilineae bacterium]
MDNEQLDLAAIRKRLANRQGKTYWRSLNEVANTKSFQEFLHREFPDGASEWKDGVSRRNFLRLMGASMALAGLTACSSSSLDKIVPYVEQPEEVIPGKPLFYATAFLLGGVASGVVVESHTGRPTKIEGNPDHPASLGATDAFAQASILTLYDPDRAKRLFGKGMAPPTWEQFIEDFNASQAGREQGQGLRILSETITSPTLAQQFEDLLAQYPQAKWHQYEPVGQNSARLGAELAFGEMVSTQYHLDKAKVILALDSDFLTSGPGNVRYARDFMDGRRVADPEHGGHGGAEMNRLYSVESVYTNTGVASDHRLAMKAAEVELFARALASKLGVSVGGGDARGHNKWLDAVAEDLLEHAGECVIIPGDQQSPAVHALAHAMNEALGNVGSTVVHTESIEANPVDQMASLRELVDDMAAGQVETLIILGGNPAFDAPADIPFADQLANVPFSVHLGLYWDETSQGCLWHIPETHYLEAWSDARAYDGTVTIMQPLIEPLYADAKSAHELLAGLMGEVDATSHDIVQAYWKNQDTDGDFKAFWKKSLFDGYVEGSALAAKAVSVGASALAGAAPQVGSGLEITFRPDATIWDGRFANNGWLQELPKPLTKHTWDAVAKVSPATAERLGLANGDLIDLNYDGRTMQAPVMIVPGQPLDSINVQLGYGRTQAGRVGDGAGFDAYAIRTASTPWFGSGLELSPTGEKYPVAFSQEHHLMEGRDLVRMGTLAEYEENPHFVHEGIHHEDISMYPKFVYNGNAWGMTVDLSACIGCNACVVACQSENNIPIVGKDEVLNNREMHWLRIDSYFEGDLDQPQVVNQPVMCQHCENAPCEIVCPAAATTHSREGLNEMAYNRCIGTRYCINNCPYKVRRFNFFQYVDVDSETLAMQRNPDVTVRSRGVVEKCTYCVQRINEGRIAAKKENRPVADGEILTACQAACPTNAIVFGNIQDEQSQVAKLKANPLNYVILGESGFRPRTSYLARLSNPNPKLEEA